MAGPLVKLPLTGRTSESRNNMEAWLPLGWVVTIQQQQLSHQRLGIDHENYKYPLLVGMTSKEVVYCTYICQA